jgi:hypothetical protein
MMVPRHILAVLYDVVSVTPILTDGYVEKGPVYGFHAPRQIWILWIFSLWGT